MQLQHRRMHRFGQRTSVAVQRLPKCVHQRSHRLIVRGSLTSEDRTVETVETPVQAAPEPVQTIAPPHYAQYPQQAMPPRPEYYVAAPPGPPMYPAPPVYKQEASSNIPWWVWMGAGILVANVARLVQDVMKKGPQQMMAEMASGMTADNAQKHVEAVRQAKLTRMAIAFEAMKQMMKSMGQPGTPGAAGPFAAAGATSPFGAAGPSSPFGPYGAANPFAPNFTPPAAPVDTTATPVTAPSAAAAAAAATPAAAAAADSNVRGDKFAARVGTPPPPTTAPVSAAPAAEDKAAAPAAVGSSSSNSASSSSSSSNKIDVVEPEVKEPTGTSSSTGPKAAGFFTDIGDGSSAASSSGAAAGEQQDPAQMTAMMEKMLKDPNMQKMLYPYLPEPMRNPESIEWMLNNPEVRKQMEGVFAQSGMGMSPEMMQMMNQMDFSQDKVQQQFSELGLKPEDVIQKVLATPDLAAGFSNPKVQQAIFDISQNPMNITKYQNDPEVMKVLEKVTEIFAPQMQNQQK